MNDTSLLGRHQLIELIEELREYTGRDRTLKFRKRKDVKAPERKGRNAGFDFFVPNDFNLESEHVLKVGDHISIPSGIQVKIPSGHVLIAFNKSGISVSYGLQVGACIVDENYTGEISLHVMNFGPNDFKIIPGMKLVQFVLLPVNYAMPMECLTEEEMYTKEDYEERGFKGFGSTGIDV